MIQGLRERVEAVTNLTTFLREGPATVTSSAIPFPLTLLIISLLISILILQFIILVQPSRRSHSPKRSTIKKVRKGAGRLVERAPPVPVSPPALIVDARSRAFRARRAITFQQEVNQQWAIQEEHPEVIYDTVATHFDEEEDEDEF
uniref:Uncharacterized protein n=1 Tax=Globodera pallida TaxID=36090 RepID=A0A183CAB5_GLOPA